MDRKWTIIPEYNCLSESIKLSREYNTAFEYNDFFNPAIYQDVEETRRRIDTYKSIDRDKSNDTLHGVFYDIAMASTDDVIRHRSRVLMEQSIETALMLGCKGVVFHTGILASLWQEKYLNAWVDNASAYFENLGNEYSSIDIYIENTFEKEPWPLVKLMNNLSKTPNLKICLDYAHASLTKTPIENWIQEMKPFLGHMHTNDNDLLNDLHMAPGKGNINYKRFKELILENSIDTNILLELNGVEEQRQALEFVTSL